MALVRPMPIIYRQTAEIREASTPEEESPAAAEEERVYVAVGKDVKESKGKLEWASKYAAANNMRLFILHVHQPARMIPTPIGAKFPACKLEPAEVNQYRQQENEKMQTILNSYVLICSGHKVMAEKLVIENDEIEKGILELVTQHGITKLIMGAAADKHYSRRMKVPKSKKAIIVGREAQRSCQISFICKGTLVCTREATIDGTGNWVTPPSPISSPSTSTSPSNQSNLRSISHGQSSPYRLTNPVISFLSRSKSEIVTTQGVGTRHTEVLSIARTRTSPMSQPESSVERNDNETKMTSRGRDAHDSVGSAWSLNGGVESSAPMSTEKGTECENGLALPPVDELEEAGTPASKSNEQEVKDIYDYLAYEQLEQAMTEAEIARQVAYEELVKRHRAEKLAMKATLNAKASENLYSKEKKLRNELEELLAREKQETDSIKAQQQVALEEMKKAHELQSELEIKVNNSNRIVTELEAKLSKEECLLKALRLEHDKLQHELDEAIRNAEYMRRRNEEASTSLYRLPDFSEYTYLELEEATNSFDLAQKIGGGGYGSVYRGILRHTPVAIKILDPKSQQGRSEFQQEVNVLSRVRHPNLVTLIGTCPEARSLIYEYLPNGSLEDRLLCKDNTCPLSWETRICIMADICSALLFLHSTKPEGIVHGDLKPANILLDSHYTGKLGDFGLCRSVSQNSVTTRCCMTDPKGTLVYMDPEFLSTGVLTTRSDIYSFGIIILRLLTGKLALGIVKEVRMALEQENLHSIVDELAGDWPFVQAKQLAYLGLRCCEMNRRNRPDLESEIWRMLEPMRASCSLESSFKLRPKSLHHVPSYFICPIFMEIMQDPHIAADGFTYEAEALRGWLENGNETSPVTNSKLANHDLIPNRALKSAIQEWLQQE